MPSHLSLTSLHSRWVVASLTEEKLSHLALSYSLFPSPSLPLSSSPFLPLSISLSLSLPPLCAESAGHARQPAAAGAAAGPDLVPLQGLSQPSPPPAPALPLLSAGSRPSSPPLLLNSSPFLILVQEKEGSPLRCVCVCNNVCKEGIYIYPQYIYRYRYRYRYRSIVFEEGSHRPRLRRLGGSRPSVTFLSVNPISYICVEEDFFFSL